MFMQTLMTKKIDTKELSKLDMFCECCGDKFPRWDINIVLPTPDWKIPADFGFACPECIEERGLLVLHTEKAKKFRRINEKLREDLSPVPIH